MEVLSNLDLCKSVAINFIGIPGCSVDVIKISRSACSGLNIDSSIETGYITAPGATISEFNGTKITTSEFNSTKIIAHEYGLIGIGGGNNIAVFTGCNGQNIAFSTSVPKFEFTGFETDILINGTEISFKGGDTGTTKQEYANFAPAEICFNPSKFTFKTSDNVSQITTCTCSLDICSDIVNIDACFCVNIDAEHELNVGTKKLMQFKSYGGIRLENVAGCGDFSITSCSKIIIKADTVEYCNANLLIYNDIDMIDSAARTLGTNEPGAKFRIFSSPVKNDLVFSVGPQTKGDDTYLMYRSYFDTTKEKVGFIRYDVGQAPANCTIDIGFNLNTSNGGRTEFVAFKSDIPTVQTVNHLEFTSPAIPANCSLYEVSLSPTVFTKTPMMQLTNKSGAAQVADLCYNKTSNKVFVGIDHTTQIAAGEYTLSVFGM